MVISRSDAKKKRKEGDTLEDSLQGSPKRTKVHAQRKFAQGSSNVSSPALTPVKDKDKVKTNGAVLSPELISSKRPKTEDFLTFLCFRGTPILPPRLDFFNVATIQDNQDEEHCSSGGDYCSSRPANMASSAQKPQKSVGTEQVTVPGTVKKNEKVENEAKKRPSTSVQALRKKYQEQRLAKQKASTLSKLAQKVKGKNMVRTRSSVLREESRTTDLFPSKRHLMKKPVGREHSISKNLKPLKYMSLRRLSVRGQPKLLRELESPVMRRGGLRSSGQLPPGSDEGLKTEKPLNHRLQPKERYDKTKPKMFVSSLSDFSSDDDQPLVKKTRPLEQIKSSSKQQLARKMVKRIVKSSRKIHPHMITRSRQHCQDDIGHYHPHHVHQNIEKPSQQRQLLQQSFQQQHEQQHQQLQQHHPLQQHQMKPARSQQPQPTVSRFSNRPTRKTKEAAALYMELLGKKLISHDGDADEDSFSVDSFPELPCSKKNEQRELEIKAKCTKEVQHQHSQEFQEFQQQHVQKKENPLNKREVYIKKEIQMKKEHNHPRKNYVKTDTISKSKTERNTDSEENKGKIQKNRKDIGKLRSQMVKRSLRIAKEDSTRIKMDRIRKKNGKSKVPNVVTQKTKTKLEINPKGRASDHISLFAFDTKLKTSVIRHSLRSRKTTHISLQVEENETEVGPKSICPRRSLRRGSRDTEQSPENSSPGNIADNGINKPQKSNNTSGHLLKKTLVKANKINLSSLEDKFSDSDEEPLKKIALKSNASRKFNVQEEKQGETTNRKLFARESKSIPQICNNIKEKCKVITKVTRASACFTDETSDKVKEGGFVSIKKVLKKKSVRYSKVMVSTDRKNKQLVEREKLSGGKIKEMSRKQKTDVYFRMKAAENCVKSSEKLGKKELSETKNNKNSYGSSKVPHAHIITQKEKNVRKKKKEKADGKNSASEQLLQITLEGKTKSEDKIASKTDAELTPDNLVPPIVKNPENTCSSNGNPPSKIYSHSVELICGEKDETRKIKHNAQNSEKINHDVLIKSPHLRKGKIDGSEKKSDLGAHVHPMRKCLVGIESEFRKMSHTNCLQKKGTSFSKKELKAEAQRRCSTSCPKETELELQRRLSMVCLKESETDTETEKKSEKEEIINGESLVKREGNKQATETSLSKLNIERNLDKYLVDNGVALCAAETVLNSTNDRDHSGKDHINVTNSNVAEKIVDNVQLSDCVFYVPAAKKEIMKNIPSTNMNANLQRIVEKNVVAPLACNNGNISRYESSVANIGSSVNPDVKICAEPVLRGLFGQNDDTLIANEITKETMCMERDLISVKTERNIFSKKANILSDSDYKGKLSLKENHRLDVSQTSDCLTNTPNKLNDFNDVLSTANVSNGVSQKHCVIAGIPSPEVFEKKDMKMKRSPHVLCRRMSEAEIQEQSEVLEKSELYNSKPETSIDLECIQNNTPLKLRASGVELEKGNVVINSLLPPDLGIRDMKVKEKLNMSAERVEKWLSESCTGNLEHKKECSLYEKNICNCGLSIIDDDLCLSDYGNDKMTMDCISADCEDEGAVKMAATVCPFTSEFAVMQSANSENLKSSNMKETNANIISPAGQTCKKKETSLSTLKERSSNVEKVAEAPYHNYSILQKPVSASVNVLEKRREWETNEKCTEASAESTCDALAGCIESRPSPWSNSNNISTSPKYNPDKETVIKNNQILNVLQNQVPNVLENTNSKSECVQERGKLSSFLSDKNIKKVKETDKSEVSSTVRTGTKLLQGSERLSEKKSIFQQRRSFPHKVKERKDLTPSANAFSPENESSVYAFETEPDSPPISTPFRRRARDSRTSSTTTSKSEDDLVKLTDEDVCFNSSNVSSSLLVPSSEKTIPSLAVNNSCSIEAQTPNDVQDSSRGVFTRSSASIAVQVNLDSEACSETSPPNIPAVEAIIPEPVPQRSMECSTQTEVAEEDDESEGHLFYIPLQQAPTPAQQVIQGVAVKLGTEGPTGPNQRVIMRAKLVTKPPNFSRPTASAQEGALGIRRSVLGPQPPRSTGILTIDQKTAFIGPSSASSVSGTYPPVVPVQPTSRSQPNTVVSENKTDATTATFENHDTKRTSLNDTSSENFEIIKAKKKETNVEAYEKSTFENIQSKLDVRDKEKKITHVTLPTPCVLATSSKASCKGSTRNSDHMLASSLKGTYGNTKRNLLKGKMSKTSNPSYTCFPSNVAKFPSVGSRAQLVEAPVFYPSEKEFQDPLEYIDRIRPVAETFGLCRVVPPQTFRPECKVSDDMRFTAYNQYVHKMLYRWGPNVKEMMAIKKYLITQSIPFTHPPLIGGMEVDLPRLYQTVQSFGGLKEVIEKKRWQRVADGMKIPKSAQDRVTKLDDIYCKYLLPYDTLSPDEREKLLDEVEEEWKQRQSRPLSQESCSTSDSPEDESDADIADEECIVKGRNMPLNAFYRIARNTMAMWFRQPEPSASEVEQEFWKHVMSRNSHVCVHSGSIDSSGCGYGFPCSKNSPFARHPWNLKVLTNNSGSVLRSIGPIMGVTVPTLHVGMLFTTCCWYRDPHGLPWIEYLHTGANKIWYGVPDSYSFVFQSAMGKLIPRYCKNKTIWLPSDTAMVPPSLLVKHGVSLCHTVQEPGQFIIVFPRAFTSSICTGYLVSESVYFAQPHWLSRAEEVFKDIQDSCEPSMFSLERLLFSIASDARSHIEVLKQVLPMILSIKQKELDNRKLLNNIGLKTSERLPLPDANVKRRKIRPAQEEEGDYECEICRANLFVSLVTNSHEEGVYCLPHAIELLTKKRHHLKYCKLMYTYDQVELNELIQKLQDKIEAKSQKKSSQGKQNASILK